MSKLEPHMVDIINFDFNVLEEKYHCPCACSGHFEIIEDDLILGERKTRCSNCGQEIIIVNWEPDTAEEISSGSTQVV